MIKFLSINLVTQSSRRIIVFYGMFYSLFAVKARLKQMISDLLIFDMNFFMSTTTRENFIVKASAATSPRLRPDKAKLI